MRADLVATDGSTLLVASPEEFREFFSEEQTYRWLLPFAHDPTNMSTLRQALAENVTSVFVDRLSDDQVLRQIARVVARACVAVDLVDLPFTISAEDPAAGGPDESPESEDLVETAEQESEYEEKKPEPVIPPEYPRLAKMTASWVDLRTRIMAAILDLLRFVGEKMVPESKVAQALEDTSEASARAVESAAGDMGSLLEGLASGPAGPGETSVLASTLKDTAVASGAGIVGAAAGSAVVLDNLGAGNTPPAPGPSALGEGLRDQAGVQGRKIEEKAGDTAAEVDRILQPEPMADPATSGVAEAMDDTVSGQTEGIVAATAAAIAVLGAMSTATALSEDGDAPSETSTALVMESAAAEEAIHNAADEAAAALDGLADVDPKPPKEPGQTKVQLVAEDPSMSLANLMVRVLIDGEEHVLKTGSDGSVELAGVPEEGFDIIAIEDGLGLEVVGVSSDDGSSGTFGASGGAGDGSAADSRGEAGADGDDDADDPDEADGATDDTDGATASSGGGAPSAPATPAAAAPEPAAEPEPEPEPEAPPGPRPLYPEEEAWLRHTNRVRGARGLSLKTRDDIPLQITKQAERRREVRRRRKKK